MWLSRKLPRQNVSFEMFVGALARFDGLCNGNLLGDMPNNIQAVLSGFIKQRGIEVLLQ